MACACSCCTHKESAALDADILGGVLSIGELIEKYSVTDSSLRRHKLNHVSAKILMDPQADAGTGTVDLMERLAQLLDDASAVRAAGLLANRGDLVLRANRESRATIEVLLTRLGISDLTVIEHAKSLNTIFDGLTALIRKYPKVAALLADELEATDDRQAAYSVRGYGEHAQRMIDKRAEAAR